jgi:hypothetical protein
VPLAVDFGRWTNATVHHKPAVVFVFNGAKPDTVTVIVVAPACMSDSIYRYQIVSTTG